MEIAVYYDEKLESIGMEFLKREEVRKVLEEVPYTRLDYSSVDKWLSSHGRGDVVIFLQDVLPYTAFNASYLELFGTGNILGDFLNRGGTVVWLGDVPFFYRLRCVQGADKNLVKDRFEVGLKSVYPKEFYLDKFNITEVEGYGLCFRDIIFNLHLDDSYSPRHISMFTKYLGFFDLSKVCYLDREVSAEATFTGKLLGYNPGRTLRPVKLTHEYEPLSVTRLVTPSCSGTYAGSWVRRVGKGYFVRLLDFPPNSEEIRDAVGIGGKIAAVIGQSAREVHP